MPAKRRRVIFRVILDLPRDASVTDAKKYVETAVTNWAGSLDPEHDPMRNLDISRVVVQTPKALR